MNDIISRQAAIEACGGYLVPANIIKQLPPAEPHWIPVTEKLPKIGEYVLCMVRQRYYGQLHVCRYVDKNKYINHPYFDWRYNGFPDVVAWMPLPELYKGETT